MKKVNITFSIPEQTREALHALVPSRQVSKFVTDAIEIALSEKKTELEAAYIEAERDPDRKKAIKEWGALDVEGWE